MATHVVRPRTLDRDKIVPVSTLHQDLLWRIFLVNADMDGDATTAWPVFQTKQNSTHEDILPDWKNRALITTWSCSHVCRRWREIIIYSPSIWGRLIDLESLVLIQPRWRAEVLRRTGGSNLTVKGKINGERPTEQEFFTSVLRDYWPRIQSLIVWTSGMPSISNPIWECLRRPAPVLQIFHLMPLQTSTNADIGALFANNAPKIHDFRSQSIKLKFVPSVPWLTHIRRLDVTHPQPMPVQNWLQVLENMPQIEFLNLTWTFDIPRDTETSVQLHLPNLRDIRLCDSLRSCAVFAAQIIPAPGCRFGMTSDFGAPRVPLPQDVTFARQHLSRYIKNWFIDNTVTGFSLSITHIDIDIHEYLDQPPDLLPTLNLSSVRPGELHTLFPFLDIFSSCDFGTITTFQFCISLYPYQSLDSYIGRFLLSLQAVETLHSNRDGLHYLSLLEEVLLEAEHRYPALPHLFFPRLRTVKVLRKPHTVSDMYDLSARDAQSFLAFLDSRRGSQTPVEVLDLTDWNHFEAVDEFNVIAGLKVIYNAGQEIQEHMCGGS
ncbi:hypothetical protein GALMADRAFT_256747 [Galerina marginata CBS 339.88]|uniref:F-box domain-containing protein n=1 Tax=Galerina marginata (strain CBS 339.88) TaxID=685588 RepID=A0A067SC76_GALM3|nr:hypothetical protein GALMADRAFT_256747 [Galerina marginata CBS 339.88]